MARLPVGDRAFFIAISLLLALWLTSCAVRPQDSLSQYRNARYGFEFSYPSHWEIVPPPDNFDGRAFRDPQNPETEIRGWARHILPVPIRDRPAALKPNFTTQQGLQGELKTEIDRQISTLTLTLHQGLVQYVWQGRSPNDSFAEHYRLFYNIAHRYRVLAESENPP